MRRHGHGNKYSAGGRQHRTQHVSPSTTFITTTRALDSRCDEMTAWGPRILTAARMTADNEKAMGNSDVLWPSKRSGRNCPESMGEHLTGGPSFVMPNQPEPSLTSTALTARTMPWLTSAPCQPARPLSIIMPDHQPSRHRVLAQAAISRTPPELNGNKWHCLQKFRIWDRATSYKKWMKKWRVLCKSLQKPDFS